MSAERMTELEQEAARAALYWRARALCECGCGLPAPIAPKSDRSKGWIRGEPRPYRRGHSHRGRELQRSEERFAKAVDRNGALPAHAPHLGPCWIWTKARTDSDYGQIWYHGKIALAHRWSYIHYRGKIPDGLELDHLCRVRSCVNPAHLEPVTSAVNVQRGSGAKLDDLAVAAIRESDLSHRALGRLYGVSHSVIGRIKRGESWAVA